MRRSGFSLLELAVVIVILGLLAGGTLGGLEIARVAKLRTVIAELAKYETTTIAFREKYLALPGDMRDATEKWGSAGGNGSDATCQNTVSYGTATCNGNGDGMILTSTAAQLDETYRAWQHLKNAELVEGVFSGSVYNLTQADLVQRVVPASKRAGIAYQYWSINKASLGWTNAPEGAAPLLSLRAGGTAAAGGGFPIRVGANSISPLDLHYIEEKLDDRKPGTGKIFVGSTAAGGNDCVTGNDARTATYKTQNKDLAGCFFHYSLL